MPNPTPGDAAIDAAQSGQPLFTTRIAIVYAGSP